MATNVIFNWLPTTTRVVVVDGFGPYPRGSLQTGPSPLSWPVKDPGDTLDYVIDYSEALAGNSGDVLATLDVTITPSDAGDVTLTASRADGDQAVLWFTGGHAGTVYSVTIIVGTNSGRNIARSVSLPVRSLAAPSAFGTIITDQNNAPLTDQGNTPLTTQ